MSRGLRVENLAKLARPYRVLIREFLGKLLEKHGKSLVSVALFGSVARGDYKETSDIDLLIIMKGVKRYSRLKRYYIILDAIEHVEDLRAKLAEEGFLTGISPVILDYEEAKYFRPLYIELAHDAVILYDKEGFLARLLKKFSKILKEEYGGRRVPMGRRWYWVFTKKNPFIDLCGVKIVE